MKLFNSLVACALLFAATNSIGQVAFGGRPIGHSDPASLPEAPLMTMPAVDVETLLIEDGEREALGIKGPYRFGYNHMVDLGLDNSGAWTELENGDRVWRLAIECPDAYSINFEFHEYVVPEGAQVFVYNDQEYLGAFTAESNPGNTVLGVTQLAGDRITIEYIEPASVQGTGNLRIGQVTHAYRDVLNKMRGLGDSGSCNNNVICPVGDAWRAQIRSVALVTLGNNLCTGQLINNCENDGTPYFLTAKHCVQGDGSTWVFRFNWDSPQCNQNLNGPTNQTISGSSIKITSTGTDVALVELNSTPPVSYNVFYTGWERSIAPPASSTAIHHPSGDIKKISFDLQSATEATVDLGHGNAQCWKIATWEDGTTEGGSSGSGLWNQNGRLVGQLYGGYAHCGNNVDDFYGRFDLSYPLLEPWLGDCGLVLDGYPAPPISIEEHHRSILGIFPNPSTGLITIMLPIRSGNSILRVHDASGRMIHSETIPTATDRHELDLSHLIEGIYVMEVLGVDHQARERLIITH